MTTTDVDVAPRHQIYFRYHAATDTWAVKCVVDGVNFTLVVTSDTTLTLRVAQHAESLLANWPTFKPTETDDIDTLAAWSKGMARIGIAAQRRGVSGLPEYAQAVANTAMMGDDGAN